LLLRRPQRRLAERNRRDNQHNSSKYSAITLITNDRASVGDQPQAVEKESD
jgi:hypothetical protein